MNMMRPNMTNAETSYLEPPEDVKSLYSSQIVLDKDNSKFMDIHIKVPITPSIKIAKYDKETRNKYFKILYAEAMTRYKSEENAKDADPYLSMTHAAKNLVNFLTPIALYFCMIKYKKHVRGKLLETNSFKENLKPRLKGLGWGMGYLFILSSIRYFILLGCESIEKDYIKNNFLQNEKEFLEYEEFKRRYILGDNYELFTPGNKNI